MPYSVLSLSKAEPGTQQGAEDSEPSSAHLEVPVEGADPAAEEGGPAEAAAVPRRRTFLPLMNRRLPQGSEVASIGLSAHVRRIITLDLR